MSLKYKTNERIALNELVISKAEKTKLISEGVAEKIWYGKGQNAWRAYVSIDEATKRGLEMKDPAKSGEHNARIQAMIFNEVAAKAERRATRRI